jgi:Arc/MetJ family transcription regulator
MNVGRLTYAYEYVISICMRTTLNIDDGVLKKASQLTGVREKTALVRMGLEALVARKSAQRLAALGGTDKNARLVPRRRFAS